MYFCSPCTLPDMPRQGQRWRQNHIGHDEQRAVRHVQQQPELRRRSSTYAVGVEIPRCAGVAVGVLLATHCYDVRPSTLLSYADLAVVARYQYRCALTRGRLQLVLSQTTQHDADTVPASPHPIAIVSNVNHLSSSTKKAIANSASM